MDARQVLREAAAGLAGHRLRAGLAMLGIAIGVGAVVAMLALGEGAKTRFAAEFDKLGAGLVMARPEAPDEDALQEGDGRPHPLTAEDGLRVAASCPLVSDWSAEVREMDATAVRGARAADAEVHGVLPSYAAMRNFQAAAGRLLEDRDLAEAAQVCVLGTAVRDDLFQPGEDPVGQEIVIGAAQADQGGAAGGGRRLRVVGILAPKGQAMWIDFDRYILAPLTTIQRRYRGAETVDQILFQVRPGTDPDRAAFEVETLLLRRHLGTRDFRVRLQAEFRETMEQTLRIFQYFIGGVAGISLLVGGIGIMNIMLISVLERTREIGLRMALGARRRHVLGQFLAEALAIGGLGGIAGVLLGPLLGMGTARLLTWAWEMEAPWRSVASPVAAAGAFAFSLTVGAVAGVYPAIKASRLDPVEALRHE